MACGADLSASWLLTSPACAVRLLNGLNLRSDGSTMSLSFSVDKFSFLNQVRTHALGCTCIRMYRQSSTATSDACASRPLPWSPGLWLCKGAVLWGPVACVCTTQPVHWELCCEFLSCASS